MRVIKKPIIIPKVLKDLLGANWTRVIEHNGFVREYRKGETIISEGDDAKEMAFVNRGKVKIISEFGPGKPHILRLAKDGEIVGFRAYGNSGRFPMSVVALADSEILFVPFQLFDEILHKSSQFCYHFMMLIGSELKQSEEHMRDLARFEMRERIAMAILINLRAFGYSREKEGYLDLTLSRSDYASITGTTYETVIRMLAELERMKLIQLDNKDIRILDEPGLNKLISDATNKPVRKSKQQS